MEGGHAIDGKVLLHFLGDKIIPIIVTLLCALAAWLVIQVFESRAQIAEYSQKSMARIHELEMASSNRLTGVETELRHIRESVERLEGKLDTALDAR